MVNYKELDFSELISLKSCLDVLNDKYVNELNSYIVNDKETMDEFWVETTNKQSKVRRILTEVIKEMEERIISD